MPERLRGRRYMPMTPREAEAIRLVALGYTWRRAAASMRVSKATVGYYVRCIKERLDLPSSSPLQRVLIALGWLTVPDKVPTRHGKSGPRKP